MMEPALRRVTRCAISATIGLLLAAGAQESSHAQVSTGAGLTTAELLSPSPDSWPTYSGDYSGRRYSTLDQINSDNVQNLTLAWASRVTSGPNDAGHPVHQGGHGDGELFASLPARIRGSILLVDGVLYMSAPDNAWAVDARDGTVLWHYWWKTLGGTHIGNRGMGMWGEYLYFETPDNYLVSLDARTGEERWNTPIASLEEQYFSTPAPVVVGSHVLVGTGNDLDAPGFLQSFDPVTGELQWKFYTVPMNEGDPGLETWASLDAARHGGGNPWVPGSYDPETNLYIFGTGEPKPAYFAEPRGDREALYTCSLIAVDVDTGKMVWYYQTSPNDTHDWDSAQTPILADIRIDGEMRKVVMTAARNGYFFTIDRVTGEHIRTGKFSDTANWAEDELNELGQPVRIPEKDHHVSGALVSSANQGAANWPPPSYSPDYGLFYVTVAESWAMYYQAELDPRGAMGLGGKEELPVGSRSYLRAIDPTTARVVWSIEYPRGGGLANGVLTTAGKLLFAGDRAGNIVARDPANGKPLWHSRIGTVSNAPQTYLLDGDQYVLVAADDMIYAFKLY